MPRATIIVVGVALTVVTYVGAYAALLNPVWYGDVSLHRSAGRRFPAYRAGGEFAETAFRPASWVDQRVRPHYWAWHEDTSPRSSATWPP